MEWSHGPPAKKEPPKKEYKPETDPYQPEYERKDSYKSMAGRGRHTVFKKNFVKSPLEPRQRNGFMVPCLKHGTTIEPISKSGGNHIAKEKRKIT